MHLLAPTTLAVVAVFLVRDPTYRFPLLALLLPLFLRGAATALALDDRRERASITAQVFSTIGFGAFVVGWLLTFAVIGFVVAVGVLSVDPSADLLKRIMFLSAAGLMLAAWFLWPWYARNVLANWPRHDVRIFTSTGNRWDRMYTARRLQQTAASGAIRWRGFGATALVVLCVMGSTAAGVYEGFLARVAEVGVLVPVPFLHLVIVREAHALCGRWAVRANDQS